MVNPNVTTLPSFPTILKIFEFIINCDHTTIPYTESYDDPTNGLLRAYTNATYI